MSEHTTLIEPPVVHQQQAEPLAAQQPHEGTQLAAPTVQSMSPSAQRQSVANSSPQVKQLRAYQRISSANVTQLQATGSPAALPTSLQAGIESLSGLAMNDVRVHYNSSQPAQLQAHAFAQGRDIHIAPGQERHLPHEAWHVVQQKQGRVKPTLQLKGKIMINDDRGLESEADMMGSKAAALGGRIQVAQPKSFHGSIESQVANFDSLAVLQGAFIRSAFPDTLFVDEDPNAKPSRYWVVAYLDDDEVAIRAEDKSRQVRVRRNSVTGNWDEVAEDDVSMGVVAPAFSSSSNASNTAPPLASASASATTTSVSATGGSGPPSTGVVSIAADEEIKHNVALPSVLPSESQGPKMSTNLTAQISLVPIATGTAAVKGGINERVYSVDQLWVERVQLGDNDRPQTRYGERQERHTVAWTLQRAAQVAQSDRPLREVLTHYATAMRELMTAPDQTDGCRHLARQVLLSLKGFDTGRETLDFWQAVVCNAAVLYLQAYQQATSSTFKQGKAKGRNEAGHMAVLRAAEEALILKQPIDKDSVVTAAEGLLDVGFYTALGEEGYYQAYHHWVAALQAAFPDLMLAHGKAIVASVGGRAVSDGVKKRLGLQSDASIAQLLQHFDAKQKAVNLSKPFSSAAVAPPAHAARRRLIAGGTDALRLDLPDELASDFIANVRLQPAAQGKSMTVATQVSDQSAPTNVEMFGYTAADLDIRSIQISDMDRPDTRFATQMSHTVAWTLVRAELRSFALAKVDTLLITLADRFLRMGGDIGSNQQEALLLNQRCLAQTLALLGQSLPIHRWQALVSELVRMYAIIYQRTLSATFADEKTHGRALGHGEAAAMKGLTANEYSLLNQGSMMDKSDAVVANLLKLLDGEINKTLTGRALANAVIHWRHALERVFPNLMLKVKADLDAQLALRPLSAEDAKAERVANIAGLVAKYEKEIAASVALVDPKARKGLDQAGAAANSRALLTGLGFTHHVMPGTGNNCAIASILDQLSRHGVNLGGLNLAQFAAEVRAAAHLQDGAQIDLMQSGVALLTHINARLIAHGKLAHPGRGMTIDLYAADNDGGLMPYQNVATIAGANPVVLTLYFNPTLDGGKGHFDSVTGPLAR